MCIGLVCHGAEILELIRVFLMLLPAKTEPGDISTIYDPMRGQAKEFRVFKRRHLRLFHSERHRTVHREICNALGSGMPTRRHRRHDRDTKNSLMLMQVR